MERRWVGVFGWSVGEGGEWVRVERERLRLSVEGSWLGEVERG